jgi:hypothetical protein
MSVDVDELRSVLEDEGIMEGCTETRDAVSPCCYFFPKSGRFKLIPSFHKIKMILNLDAKTVSTHWDKFQWFGLEGGPGNRHAYPLNIWTRLLVTRSPSSMYVSPPIRSMSVFVALPHGAE